MKKLLLYILFGFTISNVYAQFNISGNISRASGEPIQGVTVDLNGGQQATTTTDADGNYLFSNLTVGLDYTVTPGKDTDPLECVSVRDMVLTGKHVLGVDPLTSPYALIASDINNSGSLNSQDLLALQDLILNIVPTFSNNTSWQFVNAAYSFPDPANPWVEDIPGSGSINDLQQDVVLNFIGAKTGDACDCVDDAHNPAFLSLMASSLNAEPGQTATVEITCSGFTDVSGLQFSLAWDPAVLEIMGGNGSNLPGFNEETLNIGEQGLSVCWINISGVDLPDNTVVLSLQFNVLGAAGSSTAVSFVEEPTPSEVVDENCLPYALNTNDGEVKVNEEPTETALFAKVYGDTARNAPTKIKAFPNHDGIMVAGTRIDAGVKFATFSKFDRFTGELLWDFQLNEGSIIHDFEFVEETREFLLIGATEPFQIDGAAQDNESILMKVDDSGQLVFGRKYQQLGREHFNRIIRHPDPYDPQFPYYIVGTINPAANPPFYPEPPSATDRVIGLNISADGMVNWANYYDYDGTNVPDDEFHRGLFPIDVFDGGIPNNGDIVITGNDSPTNDGIVVEINGQTGVVDTAFRLPTGYDVYDGMELPGNQRLLVGSDFANSRAFIYRFNDQYTNIHGLLFEEVDVFREVGMDAQFRFYAVGTQNLGAPSTNYNVLHRIGFANSEHQVEYARFHENGETQFLDPRMGVTFNYNQIFYADSRQRTAQGGTENWDMMVGAFDLDFSSGCQNEVDPVVASFDMNAMPIMVRTFPHTLPEPTAIGMQDLDYFCEDFCAPDTCQIAYTWEELDCGAVQFTAQPQVGNTVLSYTWDVGCDDNTESEEANPLLQFDVCGDTLPVCLTVVYDNQDTCSFRDTVIISGDLTPPMITPIDNITVMGVDADVDGVCEANVMVPLPVVVDDCTNVDIVNDYTGTEDASGVYPEGITTVNYTATDGCGNVSMLQFTVNVFCEELDTCDVTFAVQPQDCGTALFTIEQTTDLVINSYSWDVNCDGIIESTEAAPELILNACGEATTVCVALEYEDGSICAYEEMVTLPADDMPPAINCPDTITVNTDPGLCTYTPSLDLFILDDCDPEPELSYEWTLPDGTQGMGSMLPDLAVGTTQVTITATDQCGNVSEACTFELVITDEEPPVLECMDVVEEVLGCSDGTIVNFPDVTAMDNCEVESITYDIESGSFFPCGETVVTATATDIYGNSATCTFSVFVEGCDNCAGITDAELTCGMVPGEYSFTISTENLTALPNEEAVVEVTSSAGTVTITDNTLTELSGTLTLDPPLVNEVTLYVDFEFPTCEFGVISCTDSIQMIRPCCESISLSDQTICSEVAMHTVSLEGDLDYLTGVDYIRWYLADEPCDSYNLAGQFAGIEDFIFSPPANSDSVCVYAEVVFLSGQPCDQLVSDTATIYLCDAPQGSLTNPNGPYCSDNLPMVFEPITFNSNHPLACPSTIQWYQDGEPVEGATGMSYVPTNLSFTGSTVDCNSEHIIKAVVTGLCGTLEVETPIRIDNVDSPVGELGLQEFEEFPLCPGDDAIIRYNAACVGPDTTGWDWLISTDNENFMPLPGAENTAIWFTNELYVDTWFRVTKHNGVCPEDEVTFFVDVKDSLTINSFTAIEDDPCDPNQVNLSVAFSPEPTQECPIIINWYKDGMLLNTSVTNMPAASYNYSAPSLAGNYYVVLEDFCCADEVSSEVVVVEPATDLILSSPCFRCNDQLITLEGVLINPPADVGCTYQWYQDGELLPGENSPVLIVDQGDATYTLEVTCGDCVYSVSQYLLQCGGDVPLSCLCTTLAEDVSAGFSFREIEPQTYELQPMAILNEGCNEVTWQWGDGTADTTSIGSDTVRHTFASIDPTEVRMQVMRTEEDGSTCTESFSMLLTSTDIIEEQLSVTIYPNPSSDRITLEFGNATLREGRIQVLDANGKLLLMNALRARQNRHYIALEGLSAGSYTVRILEGNRLVWAETVIKQ